MTKLGFSLYPENHQLEVSKAYLRLLKQYGATRIFMSLLQINSDDTTSFDLYKSIIAFANELDLKVIADISPGFIAQVGWDDQLIEKAYEFGLAGIRLDEALPIAEIVELTHNEHDIKIELNMSTDAKLLLELLDSNAKKENIIACHNFYPHEFTGLSVEHFIEMSKLYHEKGIETAAFVNAQSSTEGPWPLSEGLCTVEDHRHLPIDLQAELMKATGYIDNVLIANQFISEEELALLANTLKDEVLTFPVRALVELTETERKIIEDAHVYRGDISSYVVRSTMTRVRFASEAVAPRDQSKWVNRGSIIIDNDLYTRYKGELQVALKSFEISEKANVVAEIEPQAIELLDYLKPWQAFKLVIKD